MTPMIMIAKGAILCLTSLAAMTAIEVGLVYLLFGREALFGDRHYAQEVTMSIGAGGIIVIFLFVVATLILFPMTNRI